MKALIIDDETNIRKVLKIVLKELSFHVKDASNVKEGEELIRKESFDIALVDLRLPDGSGINMLQSIKASNPDTVVIIITAFASAENAVQAMRSGAYDYFIKPFNLDEIRIKIKNIADTIILKRKIKEIGYIDGSFEGLIGSSHIMKEVFNVIERIAQYDTNVLISGESGTGKELVARAIHKKSQRSDKPFITINCASLPSELLESELFGYTKGSFTGATTAKEGLIIAANGGSLFLDEIGEMPHSLQAKLLRFLEDKKIRPIGGSMEIDVDVRIIAASNKDLTNETVFRKDLFFRIATFEIKLPPLRERKEDIPLLIDYFVKTMSVKFDKKIDSIDPSFMNMLMSLNYAGNVRELKNIIERAVIMTDDGILKSTQVKDEPISIKTPTLGSGFDLNEFLSSIEADLLLKALKEANYVKTKAAELLGISFREFRYRLSKLDSSKNELKKSDDEDEANE
ncbi:MAG: sigma-54 dependent transcriptional regulator [Thermodesulfovibrionales bacterium]|nr:sigma-54 dependent transcriptional regulator [Thermodesulfovibrionales bacterium]